MHKIYLIATAKECYIRGLYAKTSHKKWADFESDMRMNHHEKSFPKPNMAYNIFSLFIQILKELHILFSRIYKYIAKAIKK